MEERFVFLRDHVADTIAVVSNRAEASTRGNKLRVSPAQA